MSIFYNEKYKIFYLEGKDLTYSFKIDEYGFLEHIYFGKRINQDDLSYSIFKVARGHSAYLQDMGSENTFEVINNEFPVYGRGDFREPVFAFNVDGVRVGDYYYKSHRIVDEKPMIKAMPSVKGGQTLIVVLENSLHKINIELYYTVFENLPVILRHTKIINNSNKKINIDRAYSFSLDLPDNNWELLSLHGGHLKERHIQKAKLHHGIVAIDSKYGVSSSQLNPFVAIVREETTEESGEAYGFNFVYSGNFIIKAQVNQNDTTRILGGINDYDFSWCLNENEEFETPEIVMVYSDAGIGKMSRAFHDLYRSYLINKNYVNASRPIVLNSWEAVYFDYDTNKLCEIIESVAKTGIDTFVLDDGWFGERFDDLSSLGDWYPCKQKLPNGLKPIIDCAHKNGLKFGLWFEPEMVNEKSRLYEMHPDWIIHVPNLKPCVGRYQFVLDLTRIDVRDYIVNSITKILSENEIDYVKWDMNRSLTENYSITLNDNSKEFSHRYVLGLYDILDRIIYKFPNIFFEGCASGGCRFDAGMLYYFPQIWTSDNTDAYERGYIQYGTSLCYPPSSMSCHVSVCPNHQNGRVTDFNTRTALTYLGSTGYELDPRKLSDDEKELINNDIKKYKLIENLVLNGDLYRLSYPEGTNLFAEELINKDKTNCMIIVMRPICIANGPAIRIYPKGLNPDMKYNIPKLKLCLYGSTIMNLGLLLDFEIGDFKAKIISIEECR